MHRSRTRTGRITGDRPRPSLWIGRGLRSEKGRAVSRDAIDLDLESGEQLLHCALVNRSGRRHVQHDPVAGVRVDDVGKIDQGLTDLACGTRSRERLRPEDPRGRRARATFASVAVERQFVLLERLHERTLVEPLAWLQGEGRTGAVLEKSVDVFEALEGRTGQLDAASAAASCFDDVDRDERLTRRLERGELDVRR